MNGVIYIRVSTKEQVEGTSLTTQRDACLQYAATHGITIEKVFEEQGESAKFRDRTQLLALIEFCRKKKNIQALIVWKLDRFARNVEDHFIVKRELLKHGTKIHSVTEPIDDSPVGRFTETVFAAMGQCDNDIRAHRCVNGMQGKIEDGIYPWKPPPGYVSANPRRTKKILPDAPDAKRFSAIREGWDLLLTGAASKADVRRFFSNRCLTNGRGKPFTANQIDCIFSNKYYAGIVTDPWTKTEYPGRHQPMITQEEFAQVQELLSLRSRHLPHVRTRTDLPLRGFVRCHACLRPITGSWSKGRHKRYAYYHCYWKRCLRYGKGTPRDTLETEFLSIFQRYMPRPQLISEIAKQIEIQLKSVQEHNESSGRPHKTRLAVLFKENHELIQMRQRNLISDDEFVRDHTALKNEIQSVQARLADAQAVTSADVTDVTSMLQLFSSLPAKWADIDPVFRQRFQQRVFFDGLIEGQFGTAKTSDVFTVIKDFGDGKSGLVHRPRKFWNRVFLEIIKLLGLVQTSKVFINPPKEAVPKINGSVLS
jgi:site-specific DNA recombinase